MVSCSACLLLGGAPACPHREPQRHRRRVQASSRQQHPFTWALRHGTGTTCSRLQAAHNSSWDEASGSGASTSTNPLEQLRSTRDLRARAALLQQLDGDWSMHSDSYVPSPVERCLCEELNVWQYNVMVFALSHPDLQGYDTDSQVRPALRSLKAAGISSTDCWFLITRRLQLLATPISLQRWLDFLQAYGLDARSMTTFLLQAPLELLAGESTLHQAGLVIGYLRSLGVRQEYLGPRCFCAEPELLMKDVEADLRPVTTYLMSLGMEVAQIGRLVCVWPQLLLCSVDEHLNPLVAQLKAAGASTQQAAALIIEAPQLLKPELTASLEPRLALVHALGLDDAQMQSVVSSNTRWLIARDAPGEQLELLTAAGVDAQQQAALVVACPAVLSEKVLELERKLAFLTDTLHGTLADALAAPAYLGANLMQVIGPRHAFVVQKGLQAKLPPPAGSALPVNLSTLVAGEDPDFCEVLGASINEYEGFRTVFEQQYTAGLSAAAAKEFQDELRKLGIYEGSD